MIRCDRIAVPEREFGQMLAAELPFMRRVAMSVCRQPGRAEDLAQDALLRALQAREQFSAGTNLRAWLGMITRNLWLTDRRRAWRVVEMGEGQAERVPAPANQQMMAELRDALEAVSYLPSEQQSAIMAAAEGLTIEEIAVEFGIQKGTAKSRVSRARAALDIYFGGSNGRLP